LTPFFRKMIYLLPNTNNVVALTLTEKSTLSAPIYLFRFIHSTTEVEAVCISADLSLYKSRYNKFILKTIDGTPNRLIGELNLKHGDQYEYIIYEQTSTTNLDYKLATNKVESGIMIFDKPTTERKIFENGDTTRKVFGE
jgi:hypothetical protein